MWRFGGWLWVAPANQGDRRCADHRCPRPLNVAQPWSAIAAHSHQPQARTARGVVPRGGTHKPAGHEVNRRDSRFRPLFARKSSSDNDLRLVYGIWPPALTCAAKTLEIYRAAGRFWFPPGAKRGEPVNLASGTLEPCWTLLARAESRPDWTLTGLVTICSLMARTPQGNADEHQWSNKTCARQYFGARDSLREPLASRGSDTSCF